MLLQMMVMVTWLTTSAQAEMSKPWETHEFKECKKEFLELMKEHSWESESFREQVAGAYNQKVFRNHSKKIGEWVEVYLNEGKTPSVISMIENDLKEYRFDKNCKTVMNPIAWPWHLEKVYSKKMAEDWSNTHLRALVSNGKKGMIYFWSPRFSYSVFQLPVIEAQAKKMGFEFTAIVDPRASKSEIEDALKVMRESHQKELKKSQKRNLAALESASSTYLRNTSTDIYMRNGFNHFPVTYIYNNKKIHDRWITGIMNEGGLKYMASTFADELAGEKN